MGAAFDSVSAGTALRLRLRGWPLFWVLAATLLAAELRLVTVINWSSAPDIRWLMGMNWRLSAPYFLLTFTASPLQRLFPNRTTRWLLVNRRYFGLAFAVGALCQLAPITTLALRFRPALADIHSESSQFGEDVIYLTLVLMTVTSFRAVSRYLSPTTWRRLHSAGIYLLGGLYGVSYVYFALNKPTVTYVLLGVAFTLAWGLRVAMWWRRRAELHGRKLLWVLVGITNGAMLASWSYFGIERDRGIRVVLAVALAIACVMLSLTLITAAFASLGSRISPALASERTHFYSIFVLALIWYVVFAVAARFTLAPAHISLVPVPLWMAITGVLVGAAILVPRLRARLIASAMPKA
jgi:methionine sulfoxide reductase heme-binding subunit